MAGELGLNVKLARRAGLLHDIGKSVDQEVEGSHAAVGAQLARKFNESPQVVAAIAEHHGEEPHSSVLSHIVDAANVLSGQRPGARQELLASYVQRLDDLEKLRRIVPRRAEGLRHPGRPRGARHGRELRRSPTSRR